MARPDKTLRECYSNSTEEKLTRGALKSEFDKFVKDSSKLVILDSMNYIKGFRYELHCISKSAGQKHGVVWTLCREQIAKRWNEKRSKSESEERKDYYYTPEMMDELISRYEAPDQRNRWDRPLYRVDIYSTLQDEELEKFGLKISGTDIDAVDGGDETCDSAEQALNRSVYNMHSLSDAIRDSSQSTVITTSMGTKSGFKRKVGAGFKRATKNNNTSLSETKHIDDDTQKPINAKEEGTGIQDGPRTVESAGTLEKKTKREVKDMNEIIDTILDSFLLDVEPLKAGLSTSIQRSAESNVLNDVDSISLETMKSFLAAQQAISAVGGGTIVVKIGSSGETCSMEVKRCVQNVELKRLRRQYVKWVSSNVPTDTSEEGIAKSFLSYVKNML